MGFHCCGRLMSILGGRRFALGYIRPSEKEEAIYSTVHFKRGKDKRATFFSYCTLRVKNVDTNQRLGALACKHCGKILPVFTQPHAHPRKHHSQIKRAVGVMSPPPSIPGNTIATTGQQYDKKSGQWFGSLVQSSGDDGVILVSHNPRARRSWSQFKIRVAFSRENEYLGKIIRQL